MHQNSIKFGLFSASLVLLFDQITKWVMLLSIMQPPKIIPILPFFNFVFAWNRGISFGMFNSNEKWSSWIFAVIALCIIIFLIKWLTKVTHKYSSFAIGMIIGGAMGNVIDRLLHGAVFDFLDFYVGKYHWPAFNIADAGITCGAIILILDSMRSKGKNINDNSLETK